MTGLIVFLLVSDWKNRIIVVLVVIGIWLAVIGILLIAIGLVLSKLAVSV